MERITYLGDVVIEHLHPANGKAKLDQGYEECNSPEQVSSDSAAYYAYRDGGGLEADLDKLRALVKYGQVPQRYALGIDQYDNGGLLQPGITMAVNASAEAEPVKGATA
jgi:hypothetical protein